jgi:predicted nucleic acid-binding protein
MPSPERIVINTSPLLALIAGFGDLSLLETLSQEVLVPYEVGQEILRGGQFGFGVTEFQQATFLKKLDRPLKIAPLLLNSFDLGEASVIQLALDQAISTVCIDEAMGRRIARLSNLQVTGSIGVLLRAKREGYQFSMGDAIARMVERGIRLSDTVIQIALRESREI